MRILNSPTNFLFMQKKLKLTYFLQGRRQEEGVWTTPLQFDHSRTFRINNKHQNLNK